jgi:nitroimidazol reductase NimA-like FMN-containing flavoprotein (pyridoxamine 5'-phosphate oxidase superfamily)
MRRSDREIKDRDRILELLRSNDSIILGLNDDGYPYLLPMNYGMEEVDGQVLLYFHGAGEGTKHDLIRKDPRASFEIDTGHRTYIDEVRGTCSMAYISVIGRGQIKYLPDEQKEHVMSVIMGQCGFGEFAYRKEFLPHTKIFCLVVESMTAKENKKQPSAS